MSPSFETILSPAELQTIVARLAEEISTDHHNGVVLVGVLNATVTFVADLFRSLTVASAADFLALSRYSGGTERARILKDLDVEVAGRDVVLVEEIVDTGLSCRYISELLTARGAQRVSICTLFDRPIRRILPIPLRYVGREIDERFLVGYGLDYKRRYRNLGEVLAVDPIDLDRDPADFERYAYRSNFSRPKATTGE